MAHCQTEPCIWKPTLWIIYHRYKLALSDDTAQKAITANGVNLVKCETSVKWEKSSPDLDTDQSFESKELIVKSIQSLSALNMGGLTHHFAVQDRLEEGRMECLILSQDTPLLRKGTSQWTSNKIIVVILWLYCFLIIWHMAHLKKHINFLKDS